MRRCVLRRKQVMCARRRVGMEGGFWRTRTNVRSFLKMVDVTIKA